MPVRYRRVTTGAATLLVLVVAQVLLAAGPAHAQNGGTVWVSNNKLVYAAPPNTALNVLIDVIGKKIKISAFPATVIAGFGCVQVAGNAECAVGSVTLVEADTKDLNDTLGVRGTIDNADLSVIATGGSGEDFLWVSIDGSSSLAGGADDDELQGGYGKDALHGNGGDDVLRGEEGDDILVGGPGDDWLSGGSGTDLVSYEDHSDTVTADADGAYGDDGEAGEADTILTDVENLEGGRGDDRLSGGGSDDGLSGGEGDDTLIGFAGSDLLDGGPGVDRLLGDGESAGDERSDVDVCRLGADGGVAIGCEVVERR